MQKFAEAMRIGGGWDTAWFVARKGAPRRRHQAETAPARAAVAYPDEPDYFKGPFSPPIW